MSAACEANETLMRKRARFMELYAREPELSLDIIADRLDVELRSLYRWRREAEAGIGPREPPPRRPLRL